MAAFTLMALLQLVVGNAFYLGVAGPPVASISGADTCPLEAGEGFDSMSLLSFSTQLAKQRGMKLQSSAPLTADLRPFGLGVGKKCAKAKCFECEKMKHNKLEEAVGKPIDPAAPIRPIDALAAFLDEPPEKVMYHVQQAVIPANMKGGAFKFTPEDCQEFYKLVEGFESEDAPPVSCFRKQKGTVAGFKMSPEQVCESCDCSPVPDSMDKGALTALFASAQDDHLAVLEQSISQKIASTLAGGLHKVLVKAVDFFKNFVRGLQDFLRAPVQWLENTQNQRVALKALKIGTAVGFFAIGAATGSALLAPAAMFAVHSAFALAQAAHAKYAGASMKQAAGMLVFTMTIGAVTATLALPDEAVTWLLPSTDAISHAASATGEALLDPNVLQNSVEAFDAAAGEVGESALGKAPGQLLKIGSTSLFDSKVWKAIAARKAQAESNPSTVAEVLALQAQLCEAATNEWADALAQSMSARGLAEGERHVSCGMVKPEAVEEEVAAKSDIRDDYKPADTGTLEDFLGEQAPDFPFAEAGVAPAHSKQEYPPHWGEMPQPAPTMH